MRNLKKVLSLALVFVMVLAVSAGAAFPDQAAINDDYEEAVNMLTAIKVIKGMGDGTFAPEGPVTRAQMAKMLYVAKNGTDDEAKLYAGLANPFTDVSGWATNYIKWANFKGIVKGDGGVTFRPDDQVTGVEAAKMILTAVGYDADIEGYQNNADWVFNIAEDAQELGLLLEVTPDVLGRAITREEAAQMIWKGLSLELIKGYDEGVAVKDTGVTLLNKNFDVKSHTDYLYATATKGIDGAAGYVTVNGEETEQEYVVFSDSTGWVYPALKMVDGATVDPELIGHKVVQYFVDADGDGDIDTDEDIYAVMDAGVSIEAAELPEFDEEDEVDFTYGGIVVNGAMADDGEYTALDGDTVSYIYEETKDDDGEVTDVFVAFTLVEKVRFGSAILVEDFELDDGTKVDGVTITGVETLAAADVEGSDILPTDYETAAYVLISEDHWVEASYSIAAPEYVDGKITAKTNKGVVTINDNKYEASNMTGTDIEAADLNVAAADADPMRYLVYGSKILLVDTIPGADPVEPTIETALLLAVADGELAEEGEGALEEVATAKNGKAYMMTLDGKMATYSVAEVAEEDDEYTVETLTDDFGAASNGNVEPVLIDYYVEEDGDIVIVGLTDVDEVVVAADYKATSILNAEVPAVEPSEEPTPVQYVVNADTLFVYEIEDEEGEILYDYAVTNSALKLAADAEIEVVADEGVATLIKVDLDDLLEEVVDPTITEIEKPVMIFDYVVGTNATTVTMFDGTEVKTYETTLTAVALDDMLGKLYDGATLKDGKLFSVENVIDVTAEVIADNGSYIVLVGGVKIDVAADAVKWTFDTEAATAVAGADLSAATEDEPVEVLVVVEDNAVVGLFIVK